MANSSQLQLMAEEMSEEEIVEKINKYQLACDNDRKQMELDDSEFWYEDLHMNTRMLVNYENILKIKQGK